MNQPVRLLPPISRATWGNAGGRRHPDSTRQLISLEATTVDSDILLAPTQRSGISRDQCGHRYANPLAARYFIAAKMLAQNRPSHAIAIPRLSPAPCSQNTM